MSTSNTASQTFLRFFPITLSGRAFFWGGISVALLLTTVGISFFQLTPYSLALPFLALLGGGATIRWRSLGLSGSYVALGLLLLTFYRDIPPDLRLWHMGILFTLAVDFYIVLLAVEEIEGLLASAAEGERSKERELTQTLLEVEHLVEAQGAYEKEVERLKGEIARQLEVQAEERQRVLLIESEIEWLTSEKEKFIRMAKEGTSEHNAALTKRLEEADQKIAHMSKQLEAAEQSKEVAVVEKSPFEGLYNQLREQFSEKSALLTATRKELFQVREQLLAKEHAEELAAHDGDEGVLLALSEEIISLEEEVAQLEGVVSTTLAVCE